MGQCVSSHSKKNAAARWEKRRCLAIAKEQRSRFYILRKCIIMLICWHKYNKVREFVTGYNLLREMGFSSKAVAEALAMFDNDTDKALAHFLNNPS